MKLSPAGLTMMQQFEGLRLVTYLDVAGHATIGYGHMLRNAESYPLGINRAQAALLLMQDVGYAEHAVNSLVRVPLTQGQFDSLVDFAFNLGSAAFQHSEMLSSINRLDYGAVPKQLIRYVHAGGHLQAGLVRRREAEIHSWA